MVMVITSIRKITTYAIKYYVGGLVVNEVQQGRHLAR